MILAMFIELKCIRRRCQIKWRHVQNDLVFLPQL